MGRIIAVTNLKGGIGKTTTVVNVASGLALKGVRVLLVDVDAQGNLSHAFGVRPRRTVYEVLVDNARIQDCVTPARPHLDLLAADDSLLGAQPILAKRSDWSRVLAQALRPAVSEYDIIIVDSGGSLTLLNVNALMAASDILIPTTVEPLALRGLEMLYKQLVRLKQSVSGVRAIIPTMFDPRLKQSVALLQHLKDTYGEHLIAEPIRTNVRLSEASAEGKTIFEYDPFSRGALDYARLVVHLCNIWNIQPNTPQTKAEPVAASAPVTPPIGSRPVIVTSNTATNGNGNSSANAHSNGNGHHHAIEETASVPVTTPIIVRGSGSDNGRTCPQCGNELRRATLAGYQIVFCPACKYRHQELVAQR